MSKLTAYEVLGLPPNTNDTQVIKTARTRLLLAWHPDKIKSTRWAEASDREDFTLITRYINSAYDVLVNKVGHEQFDNEQENESYRVAKLRLEEKRETFLHSPLTPLHNYEAIFSKLVADLPATAENSQRIAELQSLLSEVRLRIANTAPAAKLKEAQAQVVALKRDIKHQRECFISELHTLKLTLEQQITLLRNEISKMEMAITNLKTTNQQLATENQRLQLGAAKPKQPSARAAASFLSKQPTYFAADSAAKATAAIPKDEVPMPTEIIFELQQPSDAKDETYFQSILLKFKDDSDCDNFIAKINSKAPFLQLKKYSSAEHGSLARVLQANQKLQSINKLVSENPNIRSAIYYELLYHLLSSFNINVLDIKHSLFSQSPELQTKLTELQVADTPTKKTSTTLKNIKNIWLSVAKNAAEQWEFPEILLNFNEPGNTPDDQLSKFGNDYKTLFNNNGIQVSRNHKNNILILKYGINSPASLFMNKNPNLKGVFLLQVLMTIIPLKEKIPITIRDHYYAEAPLITNDTQLQEMLLKTKRKVDAPSPRTYGRFFYTGDQGEDDSRNPGMDVKQQHNN